MLKKNEIKIEKGILKFSLYGGYLRTKAAAYMKKWLVADSKNKEHVKK